MIGIIFAGILVLIPIYITMINIICLRKNIFKQQEEKVFNIFGLIVCFIYTLARFVYVSDIMNNYNRHYIVHGVEALNLSRNEFLYIKLIAIHNSPILMSLVGMGIISYFILILYKNKISIVFERILLLFILICFLLMLLFIIKVALVHMDLYDAFLLVFPINYILCSIRIHIDIINKNN